MRTPLTLAFAVATGVVSASEPSGRAMLPTCPGRGFLPYSYPAFGSCPCGEDGCFPPVRYYGACGDADSAYKKSFWRRWRQAHFGGGSMLDGVPCHCIYPPGRSLALPLTPQPPASEPANLREAEPIPAAESAEEPPTSRTDADAENLDRGEQKP